MRLVSGNRWVICRHKGFGNFDSDHDTIHTFPASAVEIAIDLLPGTYTVRIWQQSELTQEDLDNSDTFTLDRGEIRHIRQPGVVLL